MYVFSLLFLFLFLLCTEVVHVHVYLVIVHVYIHIDIPGLKQLAEVQQMLRGESNYKLCVWS